MSQSGIINLLVLDAHEALDEGVLLGDGKRVLHVNDAACRLYGRTREELLAAGSLIGYLDPAERRRLRQMVEEHIGAGELVPKRFETALTRPDGTTVPVEISTTALEQDGQTRTMTLIRDIGERRRHQEELQRLALHDPLTGLPNRRLLLDRLEQIVARCSRGPVSAAILFLDLDGFKRVNDVHGHAAGDELLTTIAGRLGTGMRACDSAARLGGDEFVVVCESVTDEAALAARLRALITAPVTLSTGAEIAVGVSIGVRRFGEAPEDPEVLLRDADAAMYAAKRG